jgi:uncharacterized protein (TIGR03435 family)
MRISMISTAIPRAFSFDVATIRAARPPAQNEPFFCLTPCSLGERLTVDGARAEFRNYTLYGLIVTAYHLNQFSLSPSNPNSISNTYEFAKV